MTAWAEQNLPQADALHLTELAVWRPPLLILKHLAKKMHSIVDEPDK